MIAKDPHIVYTHTSSCCTIINTQLTGFTWTYIRRKSHSKSSVFFWSFDVKSVLIISSFFSGTVPLCWPMVAAVKRCVLREHLEEVLERWRAKGEKIRCPARWYLGSNEMHSWFCCVILMLPFAARSPLCVYMYLCIYIYMLIWWTYIWIYKICIYHVCRSCGSIWDQAANIMEQQMQFCFSPPVGQ